MNPKTQGVLGEAKVLAKLVELGIPVSIPFGDNYSYDLVAEFSGKLNKIQIKSSIQETDDAIVFQLRKNRYNTTGMISSNYKEDEVDYYILYNVVKDRIYILPFQDAPKTEITIRYKPSVSGQTTKIRLEQDYLIDCYQFNK